MNNFSNNKYFYPLAKAKRVAKCTTRIMAPTIKPSTPSPDPWSSCKVPNCNALFSRERDLERHMKEQHSNKKLQCPYCPLSFVRPYNLSNHTQKTHRYALNKKATCDMETQTIIHRQSDVTIVPLGDIIRGFRDTATTTHSTHNPLTGRAGTSSLELREDNIDIVINKIKDAKERVQKSCGFKKAVIYENLLNKSKRELGLSDSEPLPKKTKHTGSNDTLDNLLEIDTTRQMTNTSTLAIMDITKDTTQTSTPQTPIFHMPDFSTCNFDTDFRPIEVATSNTLSPTTSSTLTPLLQTSRPLTGSEINLSASSSDSSLDEASRELQDSLLSQDLAVRPHQILDHLSRNPNL